MAEKVYEMSGHYKRATAELLELINKRDVLAATIKTAPLELKSEGRRILAEMDAKIDEAETGLAAEYKAHQLLCQLQEAQDALLDKMMIHTERMFIYNKHKQPPEKFKEFEAHVLSHFTPDELQAFYDRIAVREAAQLDEILARNEKQ